MEANRCHSALRIPHSALGASPLSRRNFLERMGAGLHASALAYLLQREFTSSNSLFAADAETADQPRRDFDTRPRTPHISPKATSVIHLFMNGGPSQMDLFDPKPELDRNHGKSYFDKIAGEVEFTDAAGALMRSPFKFAQHGEMGMTVSEVLPHLATQVDKIAFLRGMYTTNLTHEPALYMIHSGRMLPGLPTLGAWVTYGLGSENQNLPAYVVLDDPLGMPINLTQNWQAGFLPPVYQGTRFRSTGSPVLNLKPDFDEPDAITTLERDLVATLDRMHRNQRSGQRQLDARISSYRLAARMQMAASDALDITQETQATQQLYGLDNPTTESYGRRCLIARRLVERGVRFVQLFINGQIWDTHGDIAASLRSACDRTDKPIAGLLTDLKQRGLLDSTLMMWGGEFGRLPIAQLPPDKDERKAGRDHNKNAMCTWMAGGGVKGGTVLGATDEIGLKAVDDRVSVTDFHATMLHLLGLDYRRLFYPRNGLDEKLTGVEEPRVIDEILA